MNRTRLSIFPLFSLGFRPFFLVALLFGLMGIPLWWLIWRGGVAMEGPFQPVDWHIHEMLFGYTAAVIAGFLFTAVPNWTGRMPKQGLPLALLAGVWLLGRLAVAGLLPLGAIGVAVLDCAFLAAIWVIFANEIIVGRNWRNLKVLVPLGLLFGANVLFHGEAMFRASAYYGWRVALAAIIFLITLVGGRIVPSFTRNWLAQQRATRLPAPFGRIDAAALSLGGVALVVWAFAPASVPVAIFVALAGVAHLVRLARWRGAAIWPEPLLLMLHVAYLFVPLGFLALAAASAKITGEAGAFHLLGIGAIGGMTLAVMIRATRGHTGRNLSAGPALAIAFILIALAAIARAFLVGQEVAGIDGITLAALLWTVGFAVAVIRMSPWLLSRNVARRAPHSRPRQDPPSVAR